MNEDSLIDKWKQQMKVIEEKTGVNGIFVIVCLILSIICVYLNIFDNLITNLVGTVYPAFWTMKSIETRGDDDKQWLTYWVVFASFTIVDMFSGFIVKFVPFYFVFKILFLIWLFMPNSQGAYFVYHLMLVRVFKSFENDIDNAADKLKGYTNELVSNGNVETFTAIKKKVEVFAKIQNAFQRNPQKEDRKNVTVIEKDEDDSDNSILKYDSDQEREEEDEQIDKEEEDDSHIKSKGQIKEKKSQNKSFQKETNSKKSKKDLKAEEPIVPKAKKIKSEFKDKARNDKGQKIKIEKKQTYATPNLKLDTSLTHADKLDTSVNLNTSSSYVAPKKSNKKNKEKEN